MFYRCILLKERSEVSFVVMFVPFFVVPSACTSLVLLCILQCSPWVRQNKASSFYSCLCSYCPFFSSFFFCIKMFWNACTLCIVFCFFLIPKGLCFIVRDQCVYLGCVIPQGDYMLKLPQKHERTFFLFFLFKIKINLFLFCFFYSGGEEEQW